MSDVGDGYSSCDCDEGIKIDLPFGNATVSSRYQL